MKAKINYLGDKSYGTEHSEKLYIAKVNSGSDEVQIQFIFPKGASGAGEYSTIYSVNLGFTKQEAEEVIAALHSYLYHPQNKGIESKWITFRGMPEIHDKKILNQIAVKCDKHIFSHSITVENLSKLHIGSIEFLVVFERLGVNEPLETEITVQLNLAPKENTTFTFDVIGRKEILLDVKTLKVFGDKI